MDRLTPEQRARLDAFKAIKVKHPRLEEVDRAVTGAIEEHASSVYLLVYGPSGVGKSTVMRRVTERFASAEPNRSIVPVVLVEASSSDIGAYARLDYYRQVLTQLREHAAVKDRLVNIALSAKPTRNMRDVAEWLDIRDAVQYALQRLQVRPRVIDEAQHLMQVETYHKPVEQLNWLKNMTNQTNVLHILVGTYGLFDFRNLDAQAARRGRDLHFPRYHLETMTERREFVGALRSLLEHVPLACEMDDLLAHWRWFGELSIGCIGVLSDWMVDTVATLFREGGTTLTIEALKRSAPHPARRVRMEVDARTGEHKVEAGNATSQQQLQELLGKPARVRAASFAGGASSETLPQSLSEPREIDQPPVPTRGRVIERAPSRDPVGEMQQTGHANDGSSDYTLKPA